MSVCATPLRGTKINSTWGSETKPCGTDTLVCARACAARGGLRERDLLPCPADALARDRCSTRADLFPRARAPARPHRAPVCFGAPSRRYESAALVATVARYAVAARMRDRAGRPRGWI